MAHASAPPAYDDLPPNYDNLNQHHIVDDNNNNNNNIINTNDNNNNSNNNNSNNISYQTEAPAAAFNEPKIEYQLPPKQDAYAPSAMTMASQIDAAAAPVATVPVSGSGEAVAQQPAPILGGGQLMQVQMPDGSVQYVQMVIPNQQGQMQQGQGQIQTVQMQGMQGMQTIQQPQGGMVIIQQPGQTGMVPMQPMSGVGSAPVGNTVQMAVPAGYTPQQYQAIAKQKNERDLKNRQQSGIAMLVLGIILLVIGFFFWPLLIVGIVLTIWGSIWACNCQCCT